MSHAPPHPARRPFRRASCARVFPGFDRLEDRVLLSISVADTRVTEIKGATNALFVVSLSAPSAQPISVDYVTKDGSAIAGVDYTTTQGTVMFKPGETAKVVTVPILDDALFETDQTFALDLLNPIGDFIARSEATATIADDNDLPPQVSIDDFSQTETTSGTINATTTIHLNSASGLPVTVAYSTADVTAIAGIDYVATSGTVTFNPGETAKTITIPIIGSNVSKGTRIFTVTIGSVTNATIQRGQAIGTINDVNPPVGLFIDNTTAFQGPTGPSTALFNVHLAAPSAQVVTVQYATADKTAIAGVEYVAASGTLTFNPGQTSKSISVTVLPSTVPSANKTFLVNLSSATNSTISAGQAIGTIVNTVPGPNLSINNVQVIEGDTVTVNAVFNVTLSSPSNVPVTVNYATANLTALAGTDYTAVNGTLTFAPGQTVQTISVPILPSASPKSTVLFTVNLSGAVSALISNAQGIGTILDDDNPPFIVIDDVSVPDGPPGASVNAVFHVTLSSTSPIPVMVSYATANGTALAGQDYTATSGVLTFNPGESVKTISVPVLGDKIFEIDKQFTVNLSGPTNATIALGTGTGTILNDDPPPTLSVNNVTTAAPAAGAVNAVFTVSLSTASGVPTTVHYATADMTAMAGVDYTATSGTLTFQPGETSKPVSVPILGQTVNKPTLTFALNLSSPANAVFGVSQGIGTITNQVALPVASIADAAATKPSFGTTLANFKVQLSAPSGQPVMVSYSTADGSARAGTDYVAQSGTLTFAPGETSKTISVAVLGNPLFQNDKTFVVNLSAPVHATLGRSQATGTIHSTALPPALSIADTSVQEGNFAPTTAVFTVTLSAPSGAVTTVAYSTSDITAIAGVNYVATSGTLTFSPGQTTKTIGVTVLDDLRVLGDQTFAVTLSSPTNATIARAQAIGTIIENDSLVVTTTANDGPGSLRQAMRRANAAPVPETITFAIPGDGPFTIDVRSPLPTITNPFTIDATTQPGYSDAPLVEINGSGAGAGVNGLAIAAGNTTIKGLVIDQFTGSGIFIGGRGGDVVQANYIGTDPTGNAVRGNRIYGVLIDNTPNNLIGGFSKEDRNVISGNVLGGVYLGFAGASGNVIVGNYIGTNAAGSASVPNGLNGIFVDNAPNNLIGEVGAGNVISGNDGNGIQIFGIGSSRNRVVANLIGINAAKTAPLLNGGVGILLHNAGRPSNVIGGRTLAEHNIVLNKPSGPHRTSARVITPHTKRHK
jgi:hypothetical protein